MKKFNVTVIFTKDYSTHKAGDIADYSKDIANLFVELGVAKIKEDSRKPLDQFVITPQEPIEPQISKPKHPKFGGKQSEAQD